MRIAILGAGALGRAFAARLQTTDATVTLVTRPGRETASEFKVEQQSLWLGRSEVVTLPSTAELPNADYFILAIRGEQLTTVEGVAACEQLRARERPVIVLTPALPAGIANLKRILPLARMTLPTVAAHWFPEHSLLRYWVPPLTATQIESSDEGDDDQIRPLVELLNRCGLRAQLGRSVSRLGPATTIAFLPLQLALAVQPCFRSWLQDRVLTSQVCQGLRQARAVASRVGPIEPGVKWLVQILQYQWVLRVGCRVFPWLQPRLCAFLEEHFGRKLHAQHDLFIQEVTTIATREGLSTSALTALSENSLAKNTPREPAVE